MRRLLLAAAAVAVLAGCAGHNYEAQMLKKRDYAGMFRSVSLYSAPAPDAEIKRVAASIKNASGPTVQQEFLEQSVALLEQNKSTLNVFLDMQVYLGQAEQMALLSQSGARTFENLLYQELAQQVTVHPDRLSDKVKKAYPQLPSYLRDAQKAGFERAKLGQLDSLPNYIGVYRSILASDPGKAQELLPVIRSKVEAVASNSKDGGALLDLTNSYRATSDAAVRATVDQYIKSTRLSRKQLLDLKSEEFETLAVAELARREVRIRIESDSNDPFVDELPSALLKSDEWIVVSDDASRVIAVNRLRFQERETSLGQRTQTLSSLDFGTALLLPRNASVLFDYTTTKYDLNWSMNVRDVGAKKSKIISGKKQSERTECTNLRYRNVFGGEGALDFVPPAVQAFCSQTNGVRFESMRETAVGEIAAEMLDLIRDSKV